MRDSHPDAWESETLRLATMELRAITDLPAEFDNPEDLRDYDYEEIEDILNSHTRHLYDSVEAVYGADNLRTLERFIMQKVIDDNWVEHLTAMERLRQSIGLEAFGQRDPLVMYRREAHKMFQELQAQISRGDFYDGNQGAKSNFTLHTIREFAQIGAQAHSQVARSANQSRGNGRNNGRRRIAPSVMTKVVSDNREAVPAGSRKVGRNSRCPCGSGKKYKRCHGA